MKTKHFKRLKKLCNYYEVSKTWDPSTTKRVVGRNYIEACERYCKRYYQDECAEIKFSVSSNSRFRVKLVSSEDHWSQYIFFK
tara:strand:+ start:189 stop:437 length:249 start_codon:yes stop_codon:yes gene_type:complete